MANDGKDNVELDALLARMPEIAKAVSAFPQAVQQNAFDALIAAAGGTSTSTLQSGPPAGASTSTKQTTKRRRKPSGKGEDSAMARTRRKSGSPSVLRDLDLAPNGKTSLKDFVAEKGPKTNHDYNVVSVYYLAQTLELGAVTVNHVFTCYKDMKWREPASLTNSLSLTSARKRFLDTSNLDDIKLTPAGRNHVEQDLPPKKKAR
jgi:hypothetical protein